MVTEISSFRLGKSLGILLWLFVSMPNLVTAWSIVTGSKPDPRSQLKSKTSQFLEAPQRRAGVYEVVLKELEELELEPLCHRVAARLLVNNCQLVDGKDETSVLTDSGRRIRDFVDSYAAALAICDLERGSFSIPAQCAEFREPVLARLALQNQPQLHVSGSEIDRCLTSLATSDSAWSTWVSYRHKAVRFCEAARVDNEKAQSIHLYQRLTAVISQLAEGVEVEIQKRMEQLDLQAKEAAEKLERLNPQVKRLRDELARTQDYLSTKIEETARKSAASMHEATEDAGTLQQLLTGLLKTALEGQSNIAAAHETSLRVASEKADDQISGVMAVVAAVTASSMSLQEQMVGRRLHLSAVGVFLDSLATPANRSSQETSRAHAEALMHRQDALEKGMDRLLDATEDLSSKYKGHRLDLNQALNLTNDILEVLEATATTASSVQGSFRPSSVMVSWWPHIMFPPATLVMGSYGLPPSIIRNLGLFAFGEVMAAGVSHCQQIGWYTSRDRLLRYISGDEPEFDEEANMEDARYDFSGSH